VYLQINFFEIKPGWHKNIPRLSYASLWLLLLAVSTAAQVTNVSTVKQNKPTPAILPVVSRMDTIKPITLAEAIDLSLKQASAFKNSQINEQIAAQDVRQAKAGFYPKIVAAPSVIYTTPSLGNPVTAGVDNGSLVALTSRPPSFLGANAVSEFQALINTSGELDTSGRLKATLKRNQSLLASARLGTEIAKRDLINAVQDAYFNLSLATLRRRGAEMNLNAAQDFENNTKLQLDAGEVAPVDLVRTRLQSSTRTDELEQAQTSESVAADSLRVLIGYDFTTPVATEDLLVQMPQDNEIETYAQTAIQTRPEFAQFETDRTAAEQHVKIAKSERRLQLTYSVSSGFISDSLKPRPVYNSLGLQATIGVTIPIFDKGASRAREAQARLKLQQAENNRQLAERQFAQAFFTSRKQAISARLRIRRLAASIRDAEANVAASQARYREGEAPITEITDASNTLVIQRQSLYQAIFDYQSARAKLLRAIGQ
jgi:outer membrane protein